MYVKIYIWAKWDLGTLGGKHSFLQIYINFVPNWLNIIDWHRQVNMGSCKRLKNKKLKTLKKESYDLVSSLYYECGFEFRYFVT